MITWLVFLLFQGSCFAITDIEKIQIEAHWDVETQREERAKIVKGSEKGLINISEIIRHQPGVYLREEDGFGLRPNIGIRGTNPDRSKKIVLLEDGVLIAPAPYSAPAAYYSPSQLRIDEIAIFKGFEGVEYGPNSIGGAIDFKTPDFSDSTRIHASLAKFQTQVLKVEHSGSTKSLSYLVLASTATSDGFKKVQTSDKKGYQQQDLLIKIRKFLNSDKDHFIEVRAGLGTEISEETYLGLTHSDFNDQAYTRYFSTDPDQMKWQHQKYQVHHHVSLAENIALDSTVYRHEFNRTWYRFDRFRDKSVSVREVLMGKRPDFLAVLKGEEDTTTLGSGAEFVYNRNKRKFYSQGVQTSLKLDHSLFQEIDVYHRFFLRLHEDAARRNHSIDSKRITNGDLVAGDILDVADKDNTSSARATTFAFNSKVLMENWELDLRARVETVSQKHSNWLTNQTAEKSDDVFAPGIGLSRRTDIGGHSFQSGIRYSQGVGVAGLDIQSNEHKEESDNWELELLYTSPGGRLQLEFTPFLMDYKNITGTCSGSSGCKNSELGKTFDGGRAKISGFEARIASFARWNKFRFPLELNYTQVDARFRNSFDSSSAQWGFGTIKHGDPLPYVPQHMAVASIGVESGPWRQSLILQHLGASFDQSVALNRLTIPAYGVIDWSGEYEMQKGRSLFIGIKNLLDRKYLVAARPFGLRPGSPFSLKAGLNWEL